MGEDLITVPRLLTASALMVGGLAATYIITDAMNAYETGEYHWTQMFTGVPDRGIESSLDTNYRSFDL